MKANLLVALTVGLVGLLLMPRDLSAGDVPVRPAVYTAQADGAGVSIAAAPTTVGQPTVTTVGHRRYGVYYQPYVAPYVAPYAVAPYVAYRRPIYRPYVYRPYYRPYRPYVYGANVAPYVGPPGYYW